MDESLRVEAFPKEREGQTREGPDCGSCLRIKEPEASGSGVSKWSLGDTVPYWGLCGSAVGGGGLTGRKRLSDLDRRVVQLLSSSAYLNHV